MIRTRKQTGKLLLPFILLLLAVQGFGQSRGYIIQDDNSYREGFISFDYKKPWQVGFSYMRGGSPRTYSVDELPGFILKDSIMYVAKTVEIAGEPQRLFVETIGDSAFFFVRRDGMFFKSTEPLQQLREDDLFSYLQSLSNAPDNWNQELHLFRLKRNSLRYFASYRAAAKAPTVLFTSGGAFLSFNHSTLSTDGDSFTEVKPGPVRATSENISAGIFADLPLWPYKNLSLHAQGSYGKMRFMATKPSTNPRYDIQANIDFARISLMPQYTVRSSRLRIFAHAGPSVLYTLKSESQALATITKGDKVWLTFGPGLPFGKRTMLGFEAGAGVSIFYLPQHYLSLGVSQANTFGNQFHISNQSLTISTNL